MWTTILEFIKGLDTGVYLAVIALLPYVFTFLNERRKTTQAQKTTDSQANKENAEAHKIDADAADVITDTSMKWIERLNESIDELKQEADERDKAYRAEKLKRQQLSVIVQETKRQQVADRTAWEQERIIFLEDRKS